MGKELGLTRTAFQSAHQKASGGLWGKTLLFRSQTSVYTCPARQERWDEPPGTQHSYPGPQKQQQTSSYQHLPRTLGPHPLCRSPPGHGPAADMQVKGLGQWGSAPRVWLPCRLQRPGERSSALGAPKSLSATSGSGEAGKPRDALCAPSGPVTTLSQRAL